MKGRPDDAGVFEYACHEGNYGLEHMLRDVAALRSLNLVRAWALVPGPSWVLGPSVVR